MFGFADVSKDFVKSILKTSKTTITLLSGTIAYVIYTDHKRYQTIANIFAAGKLTGTSKENPFETTYYERPELNKRLSEAISPKFTNQYYIIKGEVGTGKSRTLTEITRKAILENGSKSAGAPVYVLATQGSTFADTLAKAVGFKFNEHINLKFLISCMLQVEQLPKKEESSKLQRTLEAIESACVLYRDQHKSAAVLIIDSADSLSDESLKRLQAKAKLWADSNICKVIFVSCDEKTDEIMQENTSLWSRAAEPIYVGDLNRRQAINMLCTGSLLENEADDVTMDETHAQQVFELVGGRVMHLLAFKRDFKYGITFENTAAQFLAKERNKFVKISQNPDMWRAVLELQKSPAKMMLFSELVKKNSLEVVNTLAEQDIIRLQRSRMGILVKFQSPITARTIDEFLRTEKKVTAYYKWRQSLFSRSLLSVVSLFFFGRSPTVSEFEVLDILAGN